MRQRSLGGGEGGGQGESQSAGDEGLRLAREQEALRRALARYMEERELSDEARELLEGAGAKMEEARGFLERGALADAELREREALAELRRGIRRYLTDLAARQGGGGAEGRRGGVRGFEDEHDLSGEARSRSREILERIRPRLQGSSDEEERRYLEELIRRF